MQKPIYTCLTKGIDMGDGGVPYANSISWAIARRGVLEFYGDCIGLGNWHFEHSKIKNPVLYKGQAILLPVKILTFDYEDKHYQFGLNPWVDPSPYLPFELKVEKMALKMSAYSILVRIALLTGLIYLILS